MIESISRLAGAVIPGRRADPDLLEGRRILVTGASSGIGRATAVQMAARGGRVVLVARREAELSTLAAEIESTGGTATWYRCDLSDAGDVDDLVRRIGEDLGGIDYLINNAGRSIMRSLHLSYDRMHDFERTMAINYFGPVRLTMGLLPAMRDQRFGHVVNVLSWGIQLKAPKFSAYLASKSALDTWARIAARETLADNVTFTNMRFGLVHTPMVVPSATLDNVRGLTADQAAAKIVRACERRTLTVNTAAGLAGEVLNLVTPRLMEQVMHRFIARAPDSAAARGEVSGTTPG